MRVKQGPFIDACYGRNENSIPLWIMRQAGRYLPEYRAVRKEASFLKLCRTPALITEVVDQPIRRFSLDAAILFSDILTILEPMGAPVTFPEGGPKLENPIDTPEAVKGLTSFDVKKELPFVFEGIKQIKERLPNLPLIGFAGSPFTIACYLIQGQGSKNFDKAKKFIHQYPDAAKELIDLITDITGHYLKAQVEAGADVVQLFDSWGGILSADDYALWSAGPTSRIFDFVKEEKVPRILFVNNVAPYYRLINEIDCEVIGIDYRVDLSEAEKMLPGKSLQGNLDPSLLFGTPELVAKKVTQIIDSVSDKSKLIFNLGHGIQPLTPIESVEALVKAVHEYR